MDEHDHDEEAREALEAALRAGLPRERRIVEKPFKRKDHQKFPYRLLQEPDRGAAAYIPSYMPYRKDDITILLASARMNGGLLPIKVRMAMLQPRVVAPEKKFSPTLALPEDEAPMRNALKRMRKRHRPG